MTNIDWDTLKDSLNKNGYALVPELLTNENCENLKQEYPDGKLFRKTVVMERYRFGVGEYKYYSYPLPKLIQELRTEIYPYLVSTANSWFKVLKINNEFPGTHAELVEKCKFAGQTKPTPLILKYRKGGYNTLHQDLYGEVCFPLQCLFMLSQQGEDYTGGEFVLTQQIPRAQSKAIVLNLNKGDMLIFTTNFKPEKGVKGYYRVNIKHGISEVRSGQRYAMGIIFHDAVS